MRTTSWRHAAIAITLAAVAGIASAGAPQAKSQAPGYYRMMLGDFEVTALSDGTIPLQPTQLLTNTSKPKVEAALKRSFLAEPVQTSVNAYLINTGSKLVLVDAGAGALFGPTVGKLAANLKAAGYQPEQVDEIYITHMHADHVGGLSADGKPVFPNAVVRADQHDADYWLSAQNLEAAPADAKDFFKAAMASINPYKDAGLRARELQQRRRGGQMTAGAAQAPRGVRRTRFSLDSAPVLALAGPPRRSS